VALAKAIYVLVNLDLVSFISIHRACWVAWQFIIRLIMRYLQAQGSRAGRGPYVMKRVSVYAYECFLQATMASGITHLPGSMRSAQITIPGQTVGYGMDILHRPVRCSENCTASSSHTTIIKTAMVGFTSPARPDTNRKLSDAYSLLY